MSAEDAGVEALARLVRIVVGRMSYRSAADHILASHWLAAHDAEVRRETAEQIAQAIAFASYMDDEGRERVTARAVRIAREAGA